MSNWLTRKKCEGCRLETDHFLTAWCRSFGLFSDRRNDQVSGNPTLQELEWKIQIAINRKAPFWTVKTRMSTEHVPLNQSIDWIIDDCLSRSKVPLEHVKSIQIPQELGLQPVQLDISGTFPQRNQSTQRSGHGRRKKSNLHCHGDQNGASQSLRRCEWKFFYSKKMQKSKFRFGCCQLLYFWGIAFSKWVKAVCTRLIPLYPEVHAEFKVIPWCWHSNAEQIILVPLNRFKAEIDFHHVLNTRMTWLSCICIYIYIYIYISYIYICIYHTYVYIIHIIYIYISYTYKFGDPKITGFP